MHSPWFIVLTAVQLANQQLQYRVMSPNRGECGVLLRHKGRGFARALELYAESQEELTTRF